MLDIVILTSELVQERTKHSSHAFLHGGTAGFPKEVRYLDCTRFPLVEKVLGARVSKDKVDQRAFSGAWLSTEPVKIGFGLYPITETVTISSMSVFVRTFFDAMPIATDLRVTCLDLCIDLTIAFENPFKSIRIGIDYLVTAVVHLRKLEALNKLFALFFGCTLAIGDQIFEFVGKRAANMSDPLFPII